ncbi:MAG: hypothetical protein KC656_04050, partial [Myxococcales bacterium]|nr:hypothetical protein [Myxococcales bacterium]
MDKATWQQRAERELGRPVARLDYSPLPEVRVPALVTAGPPSSRGTGTSAGWQVASTHAGSPEVVAESVADDVQGGVEAIRVDVRAFRGARDLAMAVNAAEPEHRPFALAHGAIGDAATLVGLIRGLRRDVSGMQLDFGLDPIGELARNGFLQGPFDKHVASGADLVRWCRDEAPRCRVFVADGTVWHDRGADEALSIALTVGTALAYLRGMEAEGLSIEDAFGAIELRQAVPGR